MVGTQRLDHALWRLVALLVHSSGFINEDDMMWQGWIHEEDPSFDRAARINLKKQADGVFKHHLLIATT